VSWVDWTLLGIYGGGLVIGWLVVVLMSFDTDWKFSDFLYVIFWPIAVPCLLMWHTLDPRELPNWIRRHWG
jgi:hypothetical protein